MNFRKKNYQRAKIKQHHQNLIADLLGGESEAELKKSYDLFLKYEEYFSKKSYDFENFIKGKFTPDFFEALRRHNLRERILERENDARVAADKMRKMNISFERKKFFGRLIQTEQEELLRNQYHFATSHLKELHENLSNGSDVNNYWATKDVERFFVTQFHDEIECEVQKLLDIGVSVNYKSEKFSFGIGVEEFKSLIANRFDVEKLNLKIAYEQKYFLFLYDKIAVRDYFSERFRVIKRRKEERNLRALAAEKTDKQRSLASSNRTASEYESQISLIDCCPYCGGELGVFSGNNSAHYEHIHPVSKGGLSTLENTVFICSSCNSKKSNMTLNSFIIEFKLDREAIFARLSILGKDF